MAHIVKKKCLDAFLSCLTKLKQAKEQNGPKLIEAGVLKELEEALTNLLKDAIKKEKGADLATLKIEEVFQLQEILTSADCSILKDFFQTGSNLVEAIAVLENLALQFDSHSTHATPEISKIVKSPFDDDFVRIDFEFDNNSESLNVYGFPSIDGSSRGTDTSCDYRGAPYGGDP